MVDRHGALTRHKTPRRGASLDSDPVAAAKEERTLHAKQFTPTDRVSVWRRAVRGSATPDATFVDAAPAAGLEVGVDASWDTAIWLNGLGTR